MATILVLCGGGIKSSVCAWRCANDNDLVLTHLSFGQMASSAELNATGLLAKNLPSAKVIPLVLPHVASLQRGGESGAPSAGAAGVVGTRTGDQEGQRLSPAMLAGVTPMILTVGMQVALRVGAATVVTGLTRTAEASHLGLAPAEPHADRRREIVHGMNIAFDALLPARSRVAIETPLMDLSYPEIIQLAVRFGIPLEDCWTCCASGVSICGVCGACQARSNAFTQARTIDPATTKVPED